MSSAVQGLSQSHRNDAPPSADTHLALCHNTIRPSGVLWDRCFPRKHALNNGSLYLSWTGWTNSLRKRLTSGLSGCSPPSNWSSSLGLGSGISNLDSTTTTIRITSLSQSSMKSRNISFRKQKILQEHDALNPFAWCGACETFFFSFKWQCYEEYDMIPYSLCNQSNKTHRSISRSSSSWGLQKDL